MQAALEVLVYLCTAETPITRVYIEIVPEAEILVIPNAYTVRLQKLPTGNVESGEDYGSVILVAKWFLLVLVDNQRTTNFSAFAYEIINNKSLFVPQFPICFHKFVKL